LTDGEEVSVSLDDVLPLDLLLQSHWTLETLPFISDSIHNDFPSRSTESLLLKDSILRGSLKEIL
jgi:hypothetical protein